MRPLPMRIRSLAVTGSMKQITRASRQPRTPPMQADARSNPRCVDGRPPARLGRAPLAWGPTGDLGRWATANPAIVKIGGTLFVHGGISAEYAKQPLDAVNARVATAMAAGDEALLSDPLGPLWYRGLVQADPDAQKVRAATTPPAPSITQEQELAAVLAAYGAQRLVIAHTPSLSRHPVHQRRPPRTHRYRHLALLRWAVELAGVRRRPDDAAHGAAHAMIRRGPMKSWFAALPLSFAVRGLRLRSRPRHPLRCSRATPRSRSRSRARFPRLPRTAARRRARQR